MPELPSQVLSALEQVYGPVALNFVLHNIPEGGAPEEIKKEWIGVQLPVRHGNLGRLAVRYKDLLTGDYKDNESPVSITGIEAVHSLEELGKHEAAAYWTPFQHGLFNFRAYEGVFQYLDQV